MVLIALVSITVYGLGFLNGRWSAPRPPADLQIMGMLASGVLRSDAEAS